MLISVKVQAQNEEISITVQRDGDVYVHHVESLPFGYGFNIYRQDPGEDFEQLNETLIQPVRSGPELVESLGLPLYNRLQNDFQTGGPTETLLRLRSDRSLALINAFTHPAIANALGLLFIDENAPRGEEVTYRIEIINAQGEPTGQTLEGTAITSPLTIEMPVNLSMEYDGNLVVASWEYPDPEMPEKVAGFNVYRATPDQRIVEKLNEAIILHTESTSFLHTAELPLDGSEYDFYVKAVDITGQETEASNRVRFRLVDIQPPPAVKKVNAYVYDKSLVEITWSTSVAPDAIGYNVYRSQRSVDPYQRVNDQPVPLLNTVFVDSTARPGNKYVYTVTALDSAGNEGKKSTPASALIEDHEPPAMPADVTAEFVEDSMAVDVSWNDNNRAADFKTYMVLRRRKEGKSFGAFSQVNDSTLREFRFRDRGLAREGFPEGAFFQYGVVAIDSATNFSDTTFVVFQIPDLEAPEPPIYFDAKNSDGYRISITWNASSSKDVIAYNLYRNDSLLTNMAFNDRLFRDETVVIGEEYVYQVTAIDSLDNESDPVSDTVFMRDFNPPTVPRNLQAAYNGDFTEITWENVPNEDLVGYRIMSCDIPTGVYEMESEGLVEENTWRDDNGSPGRWYRVIAVDTSGNESPKSDPVQAMNLNN